MGYRSDVRIITSKKGFDELNKCVDKYLKDKSSDEYHNLLNNLGFYKENDYSCCFGWNSIKWYEYSDYTDVDAVLNGLQELEDKDYSYRFARIGESYDDYEENSYESNRTEEQDLDYPYMCRYFDDDEVLKDYSNNNEGIEI